MKALKAGVLYFTLVFGTGFILGAIRILWVVPRIGTRMAELLEEPIMLVIIIVAAGWVIRWLQLTPALSNRLGMGCIALFLMLLAEFSVMLWVRGMSISEYLAHRDPISGTVYYVELGVLVILSSFIARDIVRPESTAPKLYPGISIRGKL